MHYIQNYILDKLTFADTLRNKDMRPPATEGNLYQYHLQQLQKLGFVRKVDAGYKLTGRGLAYADRHSAALKKVRRQPKVITVLFVTNQRGELLIRTKQRQPFIGMHGLVVGKMHIDETIEQAARREFAEKVNTAVPANCQFEQFGTAHSVIKQCDTVISDTIGLLLEVLVDNALPLLPNVAFHPLDSLSKLNLSPGTAELIEAFVNRSPVTEFTIDYKPL